MATLMRSKTNIRYANRGRLPGKQSPSFFHSHGCREFSAIKRRVITEIPWLSTASILTVTLYRTFLSDTSRFHVSIEISRSFGARKQTTDRWLNTD